MNIICLIDMMMLATSRVRLEGREKYDDDMTFTSELKNIHSRKENGEHKVKRNSVEKVKICSKEGGNDIRKWKKENEDSNMLKTFDLQDWRERK